MSVESISESPVTPELWARYRNNFARSLLGVVREYNRAIMARLQAQPEFSMLRLSFESVVSTLAFGPMRASKLAANLGISKQHASQLIGEVEQVGLVEKRPDPDDSRARLVALTSLGERLVKEGAQAAAAVTAEFEGFAGQDRVGNLIHQVHKLVRALDLPSLLPAAPVLTGAQSGVIGNEIMRLADYVQESLMTLSMARGFNNLRMIDAQVLMHMGSGAVRLQALADINDITPQGVGRIVRDLEQRGYVQRSPDPQDARSRLVGLSDYGFNLIAASVDSVEDLYGQFATILGDAELSYLVETLQLIYQGIMQDKPSLAQVAGVDLQGSATTATQSLLLTPEVLSLYLAYKLGADERLVKAYGDDSRPVSFADGVPLPTALVPSQLEQQLGQALNKKLDTLVKELIKITD